MTPLSHGRWQDGSKNLWLRGQSKKKPLKIQNLNISKEANYRNPIIL